MHSSNESKSIEHTIGSSFLSLSLSLSSFFLFQRPLLPPISNRAEVRPSMTIAAKKKEKKLRVTIFFVRRGRHKGEKFFIHSLLYIETDLISRCGPLSIRWRHRPQFVFWSSFKWRSTGAPFCTASEKRGQQPNSNKFPEMLLANLTSWKKREAFLLRPRPSGEGKSVMMITSYYAGRVSCPPLPLSFSTISSLTDSHFCLLPCSLYTQSAQRDTYREAFPAPPPQKRDRANELSSLDVVVVVVVVV